MMTEKEKNKVGNEGAKLNNKNPADRDEAIEETYAGSVLSAVLNNKYWEGTVPQVRVREKAAL